MKLGKSKKKNSFVGKIQKKIDLKTNAGNKRPAKRMRNIDMKKKNEREKEA